MKIKILKIIKYKETLKSQDYIQLNQELQGKIENEIYIEDFKDRITINDLEQIQIEYGIESFKDYIFITDSWTLGISSYRILHYDFKNFLIFIDNYNKEVIENYPLEMRGFIKSISNLKGLGTEILPKKLFINLNKDNLSFLSFYEEILNNVSLLDRSIFHTNSEIKVVNKRYILSDTEDFFVDNGSLNEEKIFLNKSEKLPFIPKIRNDKHSELLSLYTLNLLKEDNLEKMRLIIRILLENNDEGKINNFFAQLTNLTIDTNLDIKKKLILFNEFLYVKCNHDNVLNKMLEVIYKDKLSEKYFKSIYTHLLTGHFGKNYNFSDGIYRNLRGFYNRYVDYMKDKLKVKNLKIRNPLNRNGKIVVLIDQLLSEFHSPTVVLETTLNKILKKTNNKILLVVEENLVSREDEVIKPLWYLGNPSEALKDYHRTLFDTKRIEIVYGDIKKSSVHKEKELLMKVINYNPEVILSFSHSSTIQNVLYDHYPIVNVSLGMEMLVNQADIYLYKNGKRAKYLENQIEPEHNKNIFEFMYDSRLLESTIVYNRSDFGFSKEDFIIVTSGNRIATEIDMDLIDEMQLLLKEIPNIKWLLVGSTIPKYLSETYSEDLLNRVIHISYEEDLISLNKICDLSINPNRVGGGYAATSCLHAGIPVLMCEYESDGMTLIGRDNTFKGDYHNLMRIVKKCIRDDVFKEQLHLRQLQYNNMFRSKDNTEELLNYLHQAIQVKKGGL